MSQSKPSAITRFGMPLATAALCAVATTMLWQTLQRQAETTIEQRFMMESQLLCRPIYERVRYLRNQILAARTFVAASHSIEAEEWQTFAKGITSNSGLPCLDALGYVWAPDNQQHGAAGTVRYVFCVPEDLSNSKTPLIALRDGQDLSKSEPDKEAMDNAVKSGDLALTPPLNLPDDHGGGSIAIRCYFPDYQPKRDGGALRGWVVASIRGEKLLDGLSDTSGRIDIEMFDGDATEAKLLDNTDNVIDSPREAATGGDEKSAKRPLYEKREHIELGKRTWVVHFASRDGFNDSHGGAYNNGLLICAGIISLLMSGFAWLFCSPRRGQGV